MKRFKTVDEFMDNATAWQAELKKLRRVLQKTGLKEEVKWGGPCYTHNGKNVVGIGGFKSYFGLWFHQGALLKDDAKVLMNAQEGKTKALRQWRMASGKDIKPAIIERYVKEALGQVEAGKAIQADRKRPIEVPEQLRKALRRTKGATAAFRELRPGCQREYAEHVAEARREDTKARRIAKILPMILKGAGLNDRYR